MNVDQTDLSGIFAMLEEVKTEIQKNNKHLTLDRRRHGGENTDNEQSTVSEFDNAILENISTAITELSDRKAFTQEQTQFLRRIAGAVIRHVGKNQDKGVGKLKVLITNLSGIDNQTAVKLRDIIENLCQKHIPVDTDRFEHLTNHFIWQLEQKVQKVKRPSNGLIWYIVMWAMTLVAALLAGYFIHEFREWKRDAIYWHQQYEKVKTTLK